MISRRIFLRNGGLALVSLGFTPSFLARTVAAAGGARRKILIAIFQRGAVDGLNMVVPFGEREYYSSRPTIAIARPGSGDQAAIDLDGFFAFHPRLEPLRRLYAKGQLAIVHACGSHDHTRSHFDAQDYMESATPGVKSTSDGWLNRYLQVRRKEERTASDGAPSRGRQERSPAPLIEERAASESAPSRGWGPAPLIEEVSSFRAVSLTNQLPRTLQGKAPALAINQIGRFGIRGDGMASSSFEAQ
jgi:uncharacterized protein (DUF1501 family)